MDNLDNSYVDWKTWEPSGFGKFDVSEAVYFEAETELNARSPARVLEIGFGNGAFLGWAKSVGSDVFGVELNPVLKERARAFLGADRVFDGLYDEALSRLNGTMTHIVAFDVIEHVPMQELPGLLRIVRDLLTKTGRILLRFPNGDSPFGRISQHGDPTHVTTLGYQRLEYFARESGLRLIEIRGPKLPAHGVGLRRNVNRWMLNVTRSVIERAVARLYFGGRRVALDTNYVAILARADSPQ
jgi:SAM-dependent methyltransferase